METLVKEIYDCIMEGDVDTVQGKVPTVLKKGVTASAILNELLEK